MINVNVWLRNHLKEALEDLSLSLDCFQDYQNGRCNYKLDSRFAIIGNDSVLIPEVICVLFIYTLWKWVKQSCNCNEYSFFYRLTQEALSSMLCQWYFLSLECIRWTLSAIERIPRTVFGSLILLWIFRLTELKLR